MKKALLLVLILAVASFTLYKMVSRKDSGKEEIKEAPLAIAKNSDAFNLSFSKLMQAYYALKDAFVEWDTVKANQAALQVQQSADSLRIGDLKADTTAIETARSFMASIDGEVKGLIGENSIEQKRRSFNMLTSEIYDLIRTVRYDGAIVYHVKCPMAFGDSAEAYWLSDRSRIINPYLGKLHPTYKDKMLGCGEVVDSLDFSAKQ
jgi:hypothetical protein